MNTTLFPQPQAFASLPNLKTDGSVAIITRTKNRAVLLARALNSVLEQRYQNWHLYVVNDGGDVATVEKLLDTYRDLFGERLTVIHNPSGRTRSFWLSMMTTIAGIPIFYRKQLPFCRKTAMR